MLIKLKSKYKRAWLKALRSGEYEQCRNDLMDDSGKCCGLGVAIDVLSDDWWVRIPGQFSHWCPQSMLKCDDDPITRIASEWFKMPRGGDEIDFLNSVDNFTSSIVYLNDKKKLSLDKIAQFVEENF